MKKIVLILLLFLCINFISAVPPFQSNPTTTGISIEVPTYEFVEYNKLFKFHFHVFNSTSGLPINNQTVKCNFHLYHDGNHLLKSNDISYDGEEFEINVNANNFTDYGDYSYLVWCNRSNVGGYSGNYFYVNRTGTTYDITNIFLIIALLVLSIICLVIGGMFNQEQIIIKSSFYVISILFALISISSSMLRNHTSTELNLMGNVSLLLSIAVFLFMLLYTLIYWTIQTINNLRMKKQVRWNL